MSEREQAQSPTESAAAQFLIDARGYLFRFNGRGTRSDFWARLLCFLALAIIAIAASYIPIGLLKYPLVIIIVVATFTVWFSAFIERLHDRNKSGWYLLIFFGIPTLIRNFEKADQTFQVTFMYFETSTFLPVVSSAIFVWMMVELGCLRGTVGPNRYGLDPLESVSETPA